HPGHAHARPDGARRETRDGPAARLELDLDAVARPSDEHEVGAEARILDDGGGGELALPAAHDDEPEGEGDHDRQDLQLPIGDEAPQHWGAPAQACLPGSGRRRRSTSQTDARPAGSGDSPISVRRRARRLPGSTGESISPSTASETRPVSSETTTASSAPMRRPDSDSTALTISSVTCARSSPDAPSRAWPTRPWPRLASARRSSGAKSTTRAMTQNDQKLSSSHTVE